MVLRPRSAERLLRKALKTFRIVMITGPRQVGKTTLARLADEGRRFVTLDDLPTLSAARSDPQGFIRSLPLPVTIDEIQRAPDLLLPIKRRVDEDSDPGSFLLTGSADPLAVQGVRETLAGRLAMVPLRPLTWSERLGDADWNPLSTLLRCRTPADVIRAFTRPRMTSAALDREVLLGGFPEPSLRLKSDQRRDWNEQFARTYLERDVPLLVQPDDVASFFRFVRLVAASTGGILNLSDFARDVQLSHDTVRRWLSVLLSTFVADTLSPYWRNVRKRLTKSPKLHFVDTGLASHLQGVRSWSQAVDLNLAGSLTETWVHHHLEVFRMTAAAPASLHYFHTTAQDECDFVLESDRLIPVEVKMTHTPSPKDCGGLRVFLELFSKQAPFGLLLYPGTELVPSGDRIVAMPMTTFLGGSRASG